MTDRVLHYYQVITDPDFAKYMIHDRAVAEIGQLQGVYTPPADMEEAWKVSHKKYVEQAAWVKQMLAM